MQGDSIADPVLRLRLMARAMRRALPSVTCCALPWLPARTHGPALRNSASRLAIMSAGVTAGASTAHQMPDANPGSLCSAIVGTWGRVSRRLLLATPSATSRQLVTHHRHLHGLTDLLRDQPADHVGSAAAAVGMLTRIALLRLACCA